MRVRQAAPSGRPTAGGVLAAAIGLVLLVYFVRRAGAGDVADGIARLGWAFLAVAALGGARFLVRAAAWMRCMDGSHRLRLRGTFQAVIAGDAVGNLTPLSLIAGEPAKALMLRHREPVGRTLPALVVENLFYTLTVAIVITSGLAVLPLVLQAPGPRWLAGAVLLTVLAVLVVAAHWVVRSRVRAASRALGWLARRGGRGGVGGPDRRARARRGGRPARGVPARMVAAAARRRTRARVPLAGNRRDLPRPVADQRPHPDAAGSVPLRVDEPRRRSGVQVRAAQNRRGRGGQRAAGRADRIRHRDGG